MSGVAIARYLLSVNSTLIATVPATRIQAGVLPLDTALPAISVTQISGQQHNNVAMSSASYIITERVQVTVLATKYTEVKTILGLIRSALPHTRGTVNGFNCQSIIPDSEGPDLYYDKELMHSQSVDYMIGYIR